jgi:SAM-dependent methyltransferase
MTEARTVLESDLTAVRQREQLRRASGDHRLVAARMALVAEQLCDSAGLDAGWRVLDVAAGSGTGALAAACRGCTTVAVCEVPALLERCRRRASAKGLCVGLVEGGAESLPFPDASFDAVTSVFGCMFAADHARAAHELLRICKPGGTIALASWTPEGFVGELSVRSRRTFPRRPAPVRRRSGAPRSTCVTCGVTGSSRSRSWNGCSASGPPRPSTWSPSSGSGVGG